MAAPKIPPQAPQWTEFLSCPICYNMFNETRQKPISLGCGHTVCKACLCRFPQKKCPFDQNIIARNIEELPVNFALLQLVGVAVPEIEQVNVTDCSTNDLKYYNSAKRCIEELAMCLKPVPQFGAGASTAAPLLSRPMQRKLVILVSCQLIEEEGRARAMRAARSLGERSVTELILQHQNPQQLSANLWAAVRARGCQFLGPAMQEEVLKLILLALEDGSALSRKVLVLFVVQRLESQYPQASKTAIGHVVQLLYRASCFKVTKREEESSLMQLKEDFRTYETLRREHDSQIVQIAIEAGLRISPDQWSSLLYGDTAHKSHMQSIIDKLQTPQSFSQSVSELVIALQRSGDPANLSRLRPHLELLANIDPSPDIPPPSWENLDAVMKACRTVVQGLVEFVQTRCHRKPEAVPLQNTKYKTSMCRDLAQKGTCPRGANCTFAHSQEELERYRARNKKTGGKVMVPDMMTSSSLTARQRAELAAVTRAAYAKLHDGNVETTSVAPTATVAPTVHSHSADSISEASSGVSVPVMKAQMMHGKVTSKSPTIYTSPVLTQEEGSPSTVPIAQHAPTAAGCNQNYMDGSCRMSPPSEPHTPVHVQQVPHPIPCSQAEQSVPSYPGIMYATQGYSTQGKGSFSGNNPRQMIIADENIIKSTVTMPLNPYTERFPLPTNDSHQYLAGNRGMSTQGKTPSQQLTELEQRRSELMVQLNKNKQNPSPADSPEPYGRPSTHSVYANYEVSPASYIGKSVADSMATSLSTMSLAKHDADSYGVGPYSSSPITSYKSWSSEENYHQVEPETLCDHTSSNIQMVYEEDNTGMTSPGLVSFQSSGTEYTPQRHIPSPSPPYTTLSNTNHGMSKESDDQDDEFIPFEHTMVSKYGPISRMSKAKMKNSSPVQVTAAHIKGTTPVTAVTPLRRPYPITAQVPSRFQQPSPSSLHSDHIADPRGLRVASSLPTALMQPNVIAASSNSETALPSTLWSLWERVLNMPGLDKPAAKSTAEREQIRHELERLNLQIENLQMSEDERMARELQAIELSIQETKRQLNLDASSKQAMAKQLQEQMEQENRQQKRMEKAKKKQEEMDRQYAEKLVLDEAREKGIKMFIKQPPPE